MLSASNSTALFVPPGFAHGFQTLAPHTEIIYLIRGAYSPNSALVLNPFDETLGIRWYGKQILLSEIDRNSPTLKDAKSRIESLGL